MSTIKTLATNASAEDFINSVENETRKQDGFTLLKLYTELTGEQATMWGASMIGFGSYHYKSERSTQEGDWPLSAFSPRKQNLTLYIMPGFNDYSDLLEKLGTHKLSKACLYINKLQDVDLQILKEIIKRAHEDAVRQFSSSN